MSQRTFSTDKIPHLYVFRRAERDPANHRVASRQNPIWHPSPCLHFLHAVLDLVVSHVLPTDPTPPEGLEHDAPLPEAVVWRFSFVPKRGCELYRVDPTSVVEEEGRWGGVVPLDFVRWKMRKR